MAALAQGREGRVEPVTARAAPRRTNAIGSAPFRQFGRETARFVGSRAASMPIRVGKMSGSRQDLSGALRGASCSGTIVRGRSARGWCEGRRGEMTNSDEARHDRSLHRDGADQGAPPPKRKAARRVFRLVRFLATAFVALAFVAGVWDDATHQPIGDTLPVLAAGAALTAVVWWTFPVLLFLSAIFLDVGD